MRGRCEEMRGARVAGCAAAHLAVMRAVTTAAGREVCLRIFAEEGCERAQGEEQREQDGEAAAHLDRWYMRQGRRDRN